MTVQTLVCFKHHNGWLCTSPETTHSPSCGCEGKNPEDRKAAK